jgi:hypothetical protein
MNKKNDRPILQQLLLDPPPHVSQRCEAKARSTGEPCKRWASIGYVRCKFHGGARGSGRPPTHGKRSAQGRRDENFVRVVKGLLKTFYKIPVPVDVSMIAPGRGSDDDLAAADLVRAERE